MKKEQSSLHKSIKVELKLSLQISFTWLAFNRNSHRPEDYLLLSTTIYYSHGRAHHW